MKNFYKKGITSLELLICLLILGVLVATILPQFSKTKENQVVRGAVEDIVSALDKARSHTLASLDSSEYGVHFEEESIIIFKGKVFPSPDPNVETIEIHEPASVSTISLSGGAEELYFNRLSGTPSATGSITISSANFSKTINISATGAASVN